MNLKFSGHETFACRTFWPKKGYDFIVEQNKFSSIEAPSILGVGKNMVASIQFWMKAMNLLDGDGKVSRFAITILDEEGYDPFLEDIGTIWLLHSELVTTEYATLYNLFFNEFRIQKASFSKLQLQNFVSAIFRQVGANGFNRGTIEKDINVLCKSYNQPDYKNTKKNFEDEVSSLFLELELMKSSKVKDTNDKIVEWYSVESTERHNLPSDIVLYFILSRYKGQTIQFRNLLTDKNCPAKVFCLNREGLYKKLKEQENKREGLFISETAGNVILNIPEGLEKEDILKEYYGD
ncbi:DUF4007 family protein [Draconibacterium sp. IB214405]|uniref:DUF4007 family protein n=1 Tax=Draconibacterium sp. IB214405 TaxID=3097352 RepID=UPI002A0E79E2|nr:DUF4007 family protein [Draconibacterium sp. IB214405]MDX8338768.1 DUF4007 family protein [Draconibacterium sp. IB214405]